MFSGKIDVKVLRPADVEQSAVNDINKLLKQQDSRARELTKDRLLDIITRSRVVVAMIDGRVIATGLLVLIDCLSHEFGSIHNLVVLNGFDAITIGKRVTEELIKDIFCAEFIEAGIWLQDIQMVDVLLALNFKERSKPRYRLRYRST